MAFDEGLRILDMSKNKIGDQGMSLFIASIHDSAFFYTLHTLDLSKNSLGYEAACALRDILLGHGVALQILNIAWNQVRV